MRDALAAGFTHVKMKVGADLESDDRRAGLIRSALGREGVLMMDANQVWGVDEAIAAMARLGAHDPSSPIGISTLYQAVQGKKVPKNVDTGTALVTSANASKFG